MNGESMVDKKCPQCGLWNLEVALVCDCGYDFTTMSMPASAIASEHPSNKRTRSAWWVARIGLGVSLLAVLPYVGFAIVFLGGKYFPSLGFLYILAVVTGDYFGYIFGTAGIILGILGWVLSPGQRNILLLSIAAILLGAGGIIANYWFTQSCFWCQ